MANTLREVLVRISANATGLDKELTTALGKTKRFGQEMSSIGQSLTLGITAPLGLLGAASLKAASDMDSLTRGLAAVTKDAGPLEAQLKRLQEVAKLPGLGFKDAIEGSVRLQAAGFSANMAERSLKAFGNALATVGKGKADLDGVSLALSQIASKGKISAEEINQLAERVPQIRKAIEGAFGAGAGGWDQKEWERRGVTVEQFVEGVVSQLEKAKQVTGGVQNSFENFTDAVQRGLAAVGKSMIENFQLDKKLDAVADSIERAGKTFSNFSPAAQSSIIALAGIAAAAPPLILVTGALIEKTAVIIAFFRNWAIVGTVLGSALTPVGIVLGALALNAGKVADAWTKLRNEWENDKFLLRLRDRWKEMEDGIKGVTAALGPQVPAFALLKGVTSSGVAIVEKHTKSTLDNADAIKANATAQDEWGGPIRKTTAEFERQLEVFEKLTAATNQVAADKIFNSSGIDLMGSMTPPDVLSKEQQDAAKAAMDAWGGLGASIDKELSDALKRGAEQYPKVEKAAKKSGAEQKSVWNEVDREVSKAFGHMARGMADSIVHWKGFGETLKSVAQSFASGIMEIMIRQLFKPLEDRLASALGGLAGTASKPGIINNAVSGGSSAAGSIGGSGGSAGGGALSSVGGLAGAVNVASGVVGAVSAVIGNFQMAGMNKSLDLVVKHTLQTANDMANLRADQWARHAALFTKLDDLAQFSWRKMDELITSVRNGGGGGAGGQTVVIQIDGKTLLTAIARAAAVQSPAFG